MFLARVTPASPCRVRCLACDGIRAGQGTQLTTPHGSHRVRGWWIGTLDPSLGERTWARRLRGSFAKGCGAGETVLSQRRSHRREAYAEPKKVEALAVIELGEDAVISPRPPFWLIVAIKAGFALRHSLGREARRTGP